MLGRQLVQRAAEATDPGVVHQNIHVLEGIQNLPREGLDGLQVAYVARQCLAFAAVSRDGLGSFTKLIQMPPGDHGACAHCRKPLRDGRPDAATAAGHHRYLTR